MISIFEEAILVLQSHYGPQLSDTTPFKPVMYQLSSPHPKSPPPPPPPPKVVNNIKFSKPKASLTILLINEQYNTVFKQKNNKFYFNYLSLQHQKPQQ